MGGNVITINYYFEDDKGKLTDLDNWSVGQLETAGVICLYQLQVDKDKCLTGHILNPTVSIEASELVLPLFNYKHPCIISSL